MRKPNSAGDQIQFHSVHHEPRPKSDSIERRAIRCSVVCDGGEREAVELAARHRLHLERVD
jgi:hypothetical protein